MKTSLRYVRRHLCRGVVKTVLAVLLALLLTAAIGRLDALRLHYEVLSRSVLIQGSVLGGISVYRAEKLGEAEEVKDLFLEEVVQRPEFCKSDAPRPSATSIRLTFNSDYTRSVKGEIEWLEGWDGKKFQKTSQRVCLMPEGVAVEGEVALGSRIHITELGYGNLLIMNTGITDPEEIMALYKKSRQPTTVVGIIKGESTDISLYLPIHGMEQYANAFPGITVEYAIYTLRDYRDAQPFRERFAAETDREKTNPTLYLDMAEANRIRKMAELLNTLYPVALVTALLLGAVLPGLMVLQNSRETAILRVLGMGKRKVCWMLLIEQTVLCILGLIPGVGLSRLIGAWNGLTYPLIHFAACVIGSGVFAVLSTRRDVLSMLQSKE